MFGHHDDQATNNDDHQISDELQRAAEEAGDQSVVVPDVPVATPVHEGDDWQHPGVPLDQPDDAAVPQHTDESIPDESAPISDILSPAGGFPRSTSAQLADAPVPLPPAAPMPDPILASDIPADTAHDLIDIKQQALQELEPLIDQLDQVPEEKFRTVMMMIQATDDQSLLKLAHSVAHSIEDEKARAQALLDIVNEINYFTTQHQA